MGPELSFGRHGASDVVEKFADAESIWVATYNLGSSASDQLLTSLRKATGTVTLVTNIPARFERYYDSSGGRAARRKAREQIAKYIKRVAPARFEGEAHVYFNFSNHAKVVATETLLYVGSGNFSDESAQNYEAGITSETETHRAWLEATFEQLISRSHPHATIDDDAALQSLLPARLDALAFHSEARRVALAADATGWRDHFEPRMRAFLEELSAEERPDLGPTWHRLRKERFVQVAAELLEDLSTGIDLLLDPDPVVQRHFADLQENAAPEQVDSLSERANELAGEDQENFADRFWQLADQLDAAVSVTEGVDNTV